MVKNESSKKIDYKVAYDGYWSNADRVGEASADMAVLAEQIIYTCGFGNLLDIGSGEGGLLRELLKHGIDAFGVDVSSTVVNRCNQKIPERFTQGSVLDLPYDDGSFSTVVSTDCLEHLSPEDVPQALSEIYRVTNRFVFLQIATTHDRDGHWHLTVEGRAWWERKCFEAGLRKHPAYYKINDYESLNNDGWQIYILLEKIQNHVLVDYSLADLVKERDLHMDMLREAGSRSDAHVYRYQFASKYIRPGDVVLDAACGLGYGTHVLKSLSAGGAFQGIDGSEYAVAYANANFPDNPFPFTQGYLPDCLANFADASVDVIVSFETLEHLQQPEKLLKEFNRILTPGGRLITSVPNDWSDETGEDPNPYHFHVYTTNKFLEQLTEKFDIEHLFAQTADRVKLLSNKCTWEKREREFREVPLVHSDCGIESEWLIAIVAKTPIGGESVPYIEKLATVEEQASGGNAVAFHRDYKNPWLVKALIAMGWCTENQVLRTKWASNILLRAPRDSADYGSALCVLLYRILDGSDAIQLHELNLWAEEYVEAGKASANPSVIRWSHSIIYALGLISLARGLRHEAENLFAKVDPHQIVQFNGTLLTKSAMASYFRGMLNIQNDGKADAIFRDGISKTLSSLLVELENVAPYKKSFPDFYLKEISSVFALAARLNSAVRCLPVATSRPTLFYQAIRGDSVAQAVLIEQERRHFQAIKRELTLLSKYVSELQQGKDWLEAKWLESQSTLADLQQGKDWLEAKWREGQAELNRLKGSVIYKLIKKLGLVKDGDVQKYD